MVDAVGEVKEAGLAGTEGGAVVGGEVEPALADGDGTGPDAGEEVMAAGAGDVDAAAVAAMAPPLSQGFGGEGIFQIGGSKVHRNTSEVSGFSDKNYGEGCDLVSISRSQTEWQTGKRTKW